MHFSFDFLGLDNVDFENYSPMANELEHGSFFNPFNCTCSRALSDIKRSASASHFISGKALLRVF